MDSVAEKQALRAEMKRRLGAVPGDELAQWSAAAQERVAALAPFMAAGHVALYLAMKREMETGQLLDDCWSRNIRVSVPAYDAVRSVYGFCPFHAGQAVEHRHGAPEPVQVSRLDPGDRPDVVVVPGRAFDAAGGRLGRGGGYYDRILSTLSGADATCFVGYCCEAQLVDTVPAEAHDVAMDFIVTEEQTIPCAAAQDNMEEPRC